MFLVEVLDVTRHDLIGITGQDFFVVCHYYSYLISNWTTIQYNLKNAQRLKGRYQVISFDSQLVIILFNINSISTVELSHALLYNTQ